MAASLGKLALLLVGLFALPVLLIRAQPYDDSQMRALLVPPSGCAAPCFMGIRPGATDIWQALEVLHNHDWVARIGQYDFEQSKNPDGTITITINWEWSGAQPAVIDSSRSGSLWILDDQVVSIDVVTSLQLGDIRLGLGSPEREQMYTMQNTSGAWYTYYNWYSRDSLQMIASQPCPAGEMYRVRVVVQWTERPLELPQRESGWRVCG